MSSRAHFPTRIRWDIILFWFYLLLLVVTIGTTINVADPDLWQRMAVAEYLFKTGHFPAGDTFGYLGVPEVRPDHEYGSGLILYFAYLLGGGTAIVLLKLVTLSATLALTVRAGLGKRPPTMLDAFFYSLVILALLTSFFSTLRSEASSHILFALWVFWFQQERRGRKISICAYAFTMVLWVNLHGGFIIGLAWLGVIGGMEFLTGGDWQRRARILGLCLLATLINPFGYASWLGVYRVFFIPRPGFEEWAPVPWLHNVGYYSGYKILVLWALAVVIVHVYKTGWKKCDRTAIVLLSLILIPSLAHARQTSLFAVAVGGLLPPLFPSEKPLQEIREWKPWLHRVVIRSILVALPLVYVWRLMPTNEGFHLVYPPETCPIGAVDYLKKSGTKGNLLVGFNGGSYALWNLRGQMRVSIDGRYEVAYDYETFEKVQRFFSGDDHWRDALSNPPPDAILVNRPDPVYLMMLSEPGWTEVYRDTTHAVFRSGNQNMSP
jgi:hypothetical protein